MTKVELNSLKNKILKKSTWYNQLTGKKKDLAGFVEKLSKECLTEDEEKYISEHPSLIIEQESIDPVLLLKRLDPKNSVLGVIKEKKLEGCTEFNRSITVDDLNFPELFWEDYKSITYFWRGHTKGARRIKDVEMCEEAIKRIPEESKKKLIGILSEIVNLGLKQREFLKDLDIAVTEDIGLKELKIIFPEAYKIYKEEVKK
jgi:hypothetical protein